MTDRILDAALTVNEVVLRHPSTVRVFGSLGIDACCGGARSLAEVSRRHSIPLAVLMESLGKAIAGSSSGTCSVYNGPLGGNRLPDGA
jgi:iron-sulfur cluster repair protein YtfE (RIC family)